MKILVIRLSSMGDIIYTTPVVRCLKLQLPGSVIHFLTKPGFRYIYDNNPYLDKQLFLKDKLFDTIKELKAENYDQVIDLHNNLRSTLIKLNLHVPSSTYKKQRLLKWLSLNFNLKLMKPVHLVERYMQAVHFLGVQSDGLPVDYYIKAPYKLAELLPETHLKNYVVFVIAAAHFTKRMPNAKIIKICKAVNYPVVLIGGEDVQANADEIALATPNTYNACGKMTLDASVFILSKALKVIGFDTGVTHIAEAFNMPIASIWGGTSPELLGVQPYKVDDALVVEVDLACRPCSKFGLEQCPLGHFKCMNDIPEQLVIDFANRPPAQ